MELIWKKSSLSSGGDNCVEVADAGESILVRNSKRPEAGTLSFTRSEMAAFVGGAVNGEFNEFC